MSDWRGTSARRPSSSRAGTIRKRNRRAWPARVSSPISRPAICPGRSNGSWRRRTCLSWNDVRRLLIVKPSSLGDIVHTLPTLAAFRRRFPRATLSWLVKREWAEVLEGQPDLDDVLAVDLSVQGWPAAIRAVREGRFDLVVDLQGLLRSAVLGWASGSPARVGFANGREGSPWFYTHRVPVPDASMHAVDRYLLMARFLGAAPEKPGPSAFCLPRDPAADARVEALLAAAGVRVGTMLVALNPSARWATKQWPVASFAAVGDWLQRHGGARVAVVGGRAERSAGDEVIRLMQTAPLDLVGQTTMKELIALLRRLRVLITNDSGPMHLAAAVGTPVIALFGPTDPGRTGPYGAGHVVLHSGVPCSPCFSRRCANAVTLECLTSIRSQQVIEAATTLLKGEERCQSTRTC
ncbi:MAG: lipopolysaccharide heptosyltransferase II [Nitrospirae bacterium]|nr:MAG: lipopolysaccharide heptosyltransferase II [Nitrospirota bacterium]